MSEPVRGATRAQGRRAGRQVLWAPQPGPQTAFLRCPVFEVFFGGSRGGGKSDSVLGEWIQHAELWGPAARGILVRREATQLDDLIQRSMELFSPLGWRFQDQKKTWTSPAGATLRLRHLWDAVAAAAYQGHSYTRLYAEELTNWPTPQPILLLLATLRSPTGVPVGFRATGNPGGPGHNWVKARYIDTAPPMTIVPGDSPGQSRVFIPSRITDNPALLANDPGYPDRLKLVGSPEMVRAWLEGDWNIVAGGAFDDVWSQERHVLRPFPIPAGWTLDRSFDWGSSKPFSVGWWAESNGEDVETADGVRSFPRGTLFRFSELYGWNGKPNEGCRKLAVEIAREIKQAEEDMLVRGRVRAGPADSAIFAVENGTSIASDMERLGVRWTPSEKGPGSRIMRFERTRQYLKAGLSTPMEGPGLFFFDTCRHAIRTLPNLPRDPRKPEDVDTAAEDHAYDEISYRIGAGQPRAGYATSSAYLTGV